MSTLQLGRAGREAGENIEQFSLGQRNIEVQELVTKMMLGRNNCRLWRASSASAERIDAQLKEGAGLWRK